MGMTRKEITFDLSQEALRKHYPRKETAQDPQFFKRAYKDIRRLLGLLRSDVPPAELLPPPVPGERQKKRKVPER